MELGGRGCSRVEKSNLGECVKIMTKKLWCYSPNKSQKECARKFVALRWQTKNYHVHSLCVGWRNHAEVTPGMAYKKPKRIRPKIIWLQIPPTLFISSLKKNGKEDYGSRSQKDSGEKLYCSRSRQLSHQLPQKESEGRLWLQISKRFRRKIIWLQIPPTFFISSLSKICVENYMAPDPAIFCHQLPQKVSGEKLYGSRSRQLSSSATSKRIQRKIIWL